MLDFITQLDLTLTTMTFLQIKWKTAISLISLVHFIDYNPVALVAGVFLTPGVQDDGTDLFRDLDLRHLAG